MHLILLLFTFAGIKLTTQSWSCSDLLGHLNCGLLPEDDQCGKPTRLSPWIPKARRPIGLKNHIASKDEHFGSNDLELAPRVLGGDNARQGQFPWMAMLIVMLFGHSYTERFGCGGSLINENYVVTAAHCLGRDRHLLKSLGVRLGGHNWNKDSHCIVNGHCAPKTQDIGVVDIIRHKNYVDCVGDCHDDIALLRLRTPAKYNKYVSPICMPTSKQFLAQGFDNRQVVLAGWGQFDDSSRPSNILQKTMLEVLPLQRCNAKWRGEITDKQICTIGRRGSSSAPGDSGGPVMGYFENNHFSRYILIGVMSYKSANPYMPNVNTKVSAYNTWILDHMTP